MAAASGTVYALIDPRNNRVRYVGATTKTLRVRLYGHLKGPTAKRVKAWIDDLAASGLVPRIEAIVEGVAAEDLREVERAEITRRIIAGEKLLNESATAPARRHLEHQRELDREERERAAWEHVAHQVRAAVGGPLPPGDIVPVPLNAQALEEHHKMLRIMDALSQDAEGDRNYDELSRMGRAQEKAGELLWRSTRGMWGRLRGIAEDHFDSILATRVRYVLRDRWTNLEVASQYLALLPWSLMAVGPWAALAERAGMDTRGRDFIDWVSDDPSVRDALTTLLVRSEARMGPLSVLDNYDNRARPSTALVAMTAAHHPGFDIPDALTSEIVWFMEVMVKGGQLSAAMAELLLELEPRALNKFLGPDLASAVDSRLGLPSGTSRDVLTVLLESNNTWRVRGLDRIVERANGAFSTVETPSFRDWAGPTAPMFRAITGSLIAAEILPAPSGTTRDEYVSKVRDLWCPDLSVLDRAA